MERFTATINPPESIKPRKDNLTTLKVRDNNNNIAAYGSCNTKNYDEQVDHLIALLKDINDI